ncbi:MBL fold metallo-hydrolase [Pendulispora brunnea]|uniref:MBL fold metallo-hydrolase n=1 Tax=Pendulispora brunnea TaxID=2905690 RepID=A0ABZ2K8C6_9BACT
MYKLGSSLLPISLAVAGLSCASPSAPGASSPGGAGAEPSLSLVPYNPGVKAMFPVTSILVTGRDDALLVDAQFARKDALKLVDAVKASHKRLTTIYISQADPDYYFGLDALQDAFPAAKIVATRATVERIKATEKHKFGYWGPILKEDAPKRIVVPEPLDGSKITLEGHAIEVLGLDAAPDRTCLWIPSLKAVVGGVVVFSGVHVWMTDTEAPGARANWLALLDRIEQLQPRTVVPGHYLEGSKFDISAVRFTRDYIKVFDAEAAKAENSAALMAAMEKRYPELGLKTSLEFSSKVAKHEMTWD